MVYEQQGKYEKANEEWGAVSFRAARTAEEKAHAESDTENMRESLRVSGRRGYWENSLRIIQRNSKRPVEALSANETRASSAYALATAYAALGEKDEAFVWLENLYETHEIASIQLKLNPAFDSLRSDARFAGLLHPMGLPQ
jgi:hypothetical protein